MAIKRTRESEEMYLETTLLLHKGQPNVRAADVRDELCLAKSSVSRGVNLLEKKGYILDKNIIFNSSVRPQSTKIKNQYELSDMLSKDDLQSKGKNFSGENVKRKRKSGTVCVQAGKSLKAFTNFAIIYA